MMNRELNEQNRRFADKVIVITGASSGIGKGTALAFARGGASLVLAARRENLLIELARHCEAQGAQALVVPTDVSDQLDVAELAQAAVEKFGRFDIWINDAGVGVLGRYDEVPLSDHAQLVSTNLLGTMFGSYFALRQFRIQQAGSLINIASALGKIPAPYYASYTATKYGIVGLDAALRQELKECGEKNIHICTVCPMTMDTPFFEHAANYTGHKAQPVPPLYEPQLVIDAIVDLAEQPKDEVMVGGMGSLMNALHQIMPGMVEKMMSNQTHQAQIENSPPAAVSTGSLHNPSLRGTGITGGFKNIS